MFIYTTKTDFKAVAVNLQSVKSIKCTILTREYNQKPPLWEITFNLGSGDTSAWSYTSKDIRDEEFEKLLNLYGKEINND